MEPEPYIPGNRGFLALPLRPEEMALLERARTSHKVEACELLFSHGLVARGLASEVAPWTIRATPQGLTILSLMKRTARAERASEGG